MRQYFELITNLQIIYTYNKLNKIGACVYIACKRNSVPRSAKEIAAMFDLKVGTLTKGTKKLMNIMKTYRIDIGNKSDKMNVTTACDFVERFCSQLGFSNQQIMLTMRISNRASSLGIVEANTPPSIASGCIYFVGTLLNLRDCTKRDIAKVCNISEVTIGKCYKKLYQFQDNLLNEEERKQLGL